MILFLKFNQKVKTLFLDPDISLEIDPKEKYHFILSPSLYWIKKVSLPLKYVHEVKKVAATLFEEVLPAGNYSYFVYKDEDEFVIFAYEDSKIISLLAEKGVSLNQVSALSFAQSAFENLDEAVCINSESVLTHKDGIVVLLPSQWFDNTKTLQSLELHPSKQTIRLEQFSHIVETKTLYMIGMLLFLFFLVLLGEYLYFAKEKEELQIAKERLFSEYKLKPTLMQNRAILSKYQKQDKQEKNLRRYIDYFLKARLNKSQKILSISYDKAKLKVVLQGLSQRDVKRILSGLYKEKVKLTTVQKGDKLIVEVTL